MWPMLYPIIIIVAANTVYNICAKSAPRGMNSFAVLTITYTIAAAVSFILFFATSENKNFFTALSKTNWAPFMLGVVIVGLELGYILAYRNGWKMNTVSLTANIALAVILLLVAFVLYGERVTIRQMAGVLLCAGGLVLISL